MRRFCQVILFGILLFVAVYFFNVQAAECEIGINLSGKTQQELDEIINKCQGKVTELRQQKNTLSSQIQYMDTQIYLTSLQINSTEQKIIDTGKEIDLLGTRIEGLDTSLDYLSKLLINRITESYKRREINFLTVLLNTKSADDLLNKVKYLKSSRDNNQKLLVQVQEAKSNAEEQKKSREEKKVELNYLNQTLTAQKQSLNNQKVQKEKLLADTQNSETIYQQILSQARAQMSAFSSFVASSGLGVIAANSFGSGFDGNYFSQRDERWARQIIGNSSSDCNGHPCTVLEAGCLISSVAMTLKKKGANIDPSQIASNQNYFSANTALMKYNLPNGMSRQQISISDVDSRLSQEYVIVGINYGSCRTNSDHFVVLTSKDGGDYKMYDPLYGTNDRFYSHYSQICYAEVIN